MNKLFPAGLALALSGILCAQNAPRTYGSPSGFGNILFPGVGTAPPLRSPGLSHGQRLAGTIQGRVYPATPQTRGQRGRTVVVPYAVPFGIGAWDYGYGYGYPQQAEPSVTIVQAPPQAAQSPVVINQYFASETPRTTMKSYDSPGAGYPDPADLPPVNAAASPVEEKPTIYLIAFQSGAIYPALAYWVEDDTLHYITKDKSLNKASLALIDRETSTQLNRERRVEFTLPAAK
jgi:hypothetical protein